MSTMAETSTRPGPVIQDPLGLELRQPDHDRWVTILPNPTPGQGPCKLQYFTASGLVDHHAYANPQTAYCAALQQGYTDPDPGILDRLSQTPIWQAAYDTLSAASAPASALRQVQKALAPADSGRS